MCFAISLSDQKSNPQSPDGTYTRGRKPEPTWTHFLGSDLEPGTHFGHMICSINVNLKSDSWQ